MRYATTSRSSLAALQLRSTWPSPALAVKPPGALGAVVSDGSCGVADAVAGADSLPAASIAVTRYVYVDPFVSPVSVKARAAAGRFAVGVEGQLPSPFCR